MPGKTLWEMFLDYFGWSHVPVTVAPQPAPVVNKAVYNPLNLKPGSSLNVNTLELTSLTFLVEKTESYTLDYGKYKFDFIDYLCRSTLQEGEPVRIKLRVYPHDQPGRALQTLVFKKWDEVAYDEGFKALLTENQFNVMNGEEVEASFWRINDVKTAYVAAVKENFTGAAKEVWYWDYWRETVDVGGTKYKEFLFVEWDKADTGTFTLWRGEEVPRNDISV